MQLLIYPSSAFVGGAPNEAGAKAEGGNCQTLTLKADAAPIVLEFSDDDLVLDEIDASRNQVITEEITIDGVTYPVGTTVNASYDLINSGSGHMVTGLHFGGDGYEQGAVVGLVSTEPMAAGQSYSFSYNRTSHNKGNALEDYVPCLVAGTRVRTTLGWRVVESLEVGDLVETMDRGPQPLRYVWGQLVRGVGKAAPIHIPAGVLGDKSLTLSPEHRVLLSDDFGMRVYGAREPRLVAAKFLLGWPGIRQVPCPWVDYWHILFDRHEVIWADGVPVESYLWTVKPSQPLGAPSLADLSGRIDPESLLKSWPPVRPVVRRRELCLPRERTGLTGPARKESACRAHIF